MSGGPPKNPGANGYCKTGEDVNDSGLWIFTREQVAPKQLVENVRKVATGLGYDVSSLLPVQQEGCLYADLQG